ncbi:MAG: hypothetical protein LC769_12950, partial [Chloroflexi bacterium]|nr:hypothetical protein [Chloroflexota bacterium]
IAQAVRVTEDGRRSLRDAVGQHLRDKHLLLLLDNFEHVVEAAPLVADLLSACPGLRVLATSRARLHVSGEHLYLVPPLRTPDPDHLPPLADLAEAPAVALLVQRAQATAPDFALDAASAPAIAALCGRLDGLPLALELVAPRLAVLSPALLLRRLTSRLRLLTDGARDLPERQRSLRATLDWSYALLSSGEQAAFRRLSVVPANCALEAAEAVCAAGGSSDAAAFPSAGRDMVEWIGALIDKSLLQREVGPEGEPRVAMLETVREFGLERLEEAGEGEPARRARPGRPGARGGIDGRRVRRAHAPRAEPGRGPRPGGHARPCGGADRADDGGALRGCVCPGGGVGRGGAHPATRPRR